MGLPIAYYPIAYFWGVGVINGRWVSLRINYRQFVGDKIERLIFVSNAEHC